MIDQALNWGIEVIRAVQGCIKSPAMTVIMKGISFLGTQWFYLLAFPFIYWCVDRKKGTRIGLIFFISAFCNSWVKDLCGQPRPYNLDPSVGLDQEPTHGFPSGHAQNSLVFWGASAWQLMASPWKIIVPVLVVLLVSFSRVYLGVHFPTDIFGGWLIGAVLLVIDYFFGGRIARALERAQPRIRAALASLVALIMLALLRSDTSVSGIFFGVAMGFAFVPEAAPFSASGSAAQKALRILLGLGVTALIYLGLKAVFPKAGSPLYDLFHFLRYAIIGIWGTLGAPWVFLKTGLAKREEKAAA